MRVLLIHADRFEYEVKEPTKMAEEIPRGHPKRHQFKEVLVAFSTIESSDDDVEAIAENASVDFADVLSKVKAERLVLYPYAHLSSNLASPELAVDVLKAIEAQLKEKGIEVHRSPFGWYK
ncbi:MAG: threonyl-tRNA synthetase editing domain-containing protein, partial [Thermoplasmata archaeon]